MYTCAENTLIHNFKHIFLEPFWHRFTLWFVIVVHSERKSDPLLIIMLKAQVIILALAVISPRGPVRQLISSFTFKLEPPVTRYCPMLDIYMHT